ncbi:MAG: phenylalanine--tRNA ligase subunit beta [Spirochaetia bacterium]|jgi:phenylalanyl-tRNA synthetase beta chain|nr:phenylalanine--tRNA ligase subunit beta [Spirochaetia bacterium]
MYLSSNILSQMVDLSGIKPDELALKITMASAEIEAVEYINTHLEKIITAKILDVKPHPDSDHLTLVELDTGGETVKVVCGAPNHRKDDVVALAPSGTVFPDGLVIKKSKIRGQESNGMICSKKEMGLSDDHSGVMILPPGTKIGMPMSSLYPEWVDVRFEIDNKSITHRPDLWSHIGFAREIGAILGRPVKDPVDYSLASGLVQKEELSVQVENTEACPRYSALMIKNIKTAESPEWLKAMVSAIGMRPISNIVDVTNYVMAELGEPMHAFDIKKLNGTKIIVRMAKNGEPITTLDSRKHTLTEEDIVIADERGPVGLAGVMGGENSEIEDSTTGVILEAANFNPVNIRKTAARYNARTEAAMRFEKSLSPENTTGALLRCYELIKRCCPQAEAVSEIADSYPNKQEELTISIDTDTIRRQLGISIPDEKITGILTALSFDVKSNGKALTVGVPKYRSTKDVTIPSDIVEEVGRIYGYDNIPPEPPLVPCLPPPRNELRLFERKLKDILSRDCGMTEVSGYSFVGEETLKAAGIDDDKELRLKNPLSQEADRLNRSLAPNILRNIGLNARHFDSFSIYEMNRVYLKDDRKSTQLIGEERRITGAVYTKKTGSPVFYEGKNIVQHLAGKIRVKKARFLPAAENLPPYAHPGRTVSLEADGVSAGLIFELHPKTAAAFDIKGSAVLFDLSTDVLFKSKKEEIVFAELRRFPEVPFELSVVSGEFVNAADISLIIAKSGGKFIESVDVIGVYQGEQIGEGKKSVSFKVIFAAPDRTLESAEIDAMQKKIISELASNGFSLR